MKTMKKKFSNIFLINVDFFYFTDFKKQNMEINLYENTNNFAQLLTE